MKKVAVITGTTSGIGKAIAQYYYKEGFAYVVGINRKSVNMGDAYYLHRNFVFDLSDPIEVDKAAAEITHQFQDHGIDVLVNNAGVMFLDDLETEALETVATDLLAPIQLCNYLLGQIKDGGHIINIASVSGIMGDTDAPVYSACKAGIINLTRSLAKMAAPYVRVNCISPGFFNTNLVEGDTPQELIDKIPLEREAQTIEIIPVIDMLQKSTYITGANIIIDGGLSL